MEDDFSKVETSFVGSAVHWDEAFAIVPHEKALYIGGMTRWREFSPGGAAHTVLDGVTLPEPASGEDRAYWWRVGEEPARPEPDPDRLSLLLAHSLNGSPKGLAGPSEDRRPVHGKHAVEVDVENPLDVLSARPGHLDPARADVVGLDETHEPH